MDSVIQSLPSIATFLSIILAIYAVNNYYRQKRFDEKLRVYKQYLSIVANATLSEEKQREINLNQTHILHKQELILFASKEIVDLAGEIEPLDFTDNNPNKDRQYEKYLLLLNMMRLDLLKSNKKISVETLRKLLG